MKAKMIFASMLLALSAGVASANDIQVNAGVIPTDPLNPWSDIFSHTSGAFTDTIDFTIPYPYLGSSANPLYLTLHGTLVTNIANLVYTVYSGTSAVNSAPIVSYSGDGTSYDLSLTASGPYHILVKGDVLGTNTKGSYALALVSSVPEADTYAMMLMGIGMLGYIARRRQQRG
jgi:hypothetical protein